ncbi:MAG: type II toxin-antitoxin system HipA family toxin [Planctomycetes bacterium]|nr:type II toxin-antitoxin system HipA family toxin [Planctomycetota bacterium]
MKRLIVYLNRDAVGALTQDASGLLGFRYSPEWLRQPGAIPLSRSLPLRGEPFHGKHARPFFAGILPDEGPRQQIAAILGVSERNDFAILERIGGECAGAVSLLPEGIPLADPGERRLRKLNELELREIVAELPRRPLLAGREGVRLSLAGAQGKLPVVIEGGTIALPLGNTPSTHIIKPEPKRFPGLVAAEVLSMTLAKAVGLAVPPVSRRLIGDRPCLVVQRYDRTVGPDGAVQRMHQEDFCQAMGFAPERKYQQEGGPLLRDCIAMLREWSTAPVLDIRDFLDGVIFNMLIGNADAHGKNYSLLYRQGERRLAPFYDLVCTLAWPELSKTPAMKIGQCDSLDAITPAHWQKMTQEARLGWPMVRERLANLCRVVQVEVREGDLRQASGDDAMFERMAGIIETRASSLLQALA